MFGTSSKARTDRVIADVLPPVDAIAVDDGDLHVAIAGAGITLVLLHGWTLDHRCWLPQLPLAGQARLVLPDRRGCGRSTAPSRLAEEWRDIDRLAGRERFVLVGLSQGASVALDYARRRPDRLRALVLVGAPLAALTPREDEDEALPHAQYAALVRDGAIAAMRRGWADHVLLRRTPRAAPLVEAMLGDYDGRDLLAPPAPIAIAADDIAALPMPVLAIVGSDDTAWRRRVADFIAATAPQGEVRRIAGAGHLCNLDNPARFNAVLADFLAPLLD
ncbi:alpha/beta fold hydrolase [Sphingomonas qomolangmaensis]|uniref:Alpha/beta hydrolase n=1 Tax=Sphingomonas qomolangmaensis TaxID=2918765 RepID=A0ABY5LCQ6_9SPHN|nr:alpha/beta hydrolase [Sphingomonas qomolangmaensis]UUL83681.1 alpha/beta hydrolase [Sphingomonas qomolangmaensis]